MGANSFRKRVFQGPLTLGLHSTTFRSALPSATLPYPRRFHHRANRALVISLSSVLVGLDRRSLYAGALSGFHLFGYPLQFFHRAKPRTCSFRFLLFPSVTTDVCFTRVLSQVFTCSGTRAGSITAQTAHLPFSLFFCFCRLLPTFVFRGCSHRFSPVRIPTPIPSPRKPRTSFFSLSSFPSVTTDVCFSRVLSQVFTCSGTRASF